MAAVQIKKNYVSYHLMPVCAPEILKKVSPALKKRMQGKTCFNFKKPDKVLFEELERLTPLAIACFRKAGFVSDEGD